MSNFRVAEMRTNNIAYLARWRARVRIDPPYQRQGEVWSRSKQQLLIDSILNEFDIPKIYVHEHGPIDVDGRECTFSLIDGRQRLEAIWDFMDGKFALPSDFKTLADGSDAGHGMTYTELLEEEPDLAAQFTATQIDIMLVDTDDIELVEEMFSRLNEAVPLNAAEKRNGRGGPLRAAVRQLCETAFFRDKLPFTNTRYRHYDLATKLLLLEHASGPTDTKKRQLDDFWEDIRDSQDDARATHLRESVSSVLAEMESTFTDEDRLLSVLGMISVYYLYYRDVVAGEKPRPRREQLVEFQQVRQMSRYDDEESLSRNQRRLVEFDRLSQSPNDKGAIEFRLSVFRDWLADPAAFESSP